MKRINCFQNFKLYFSGCNILQFDKYILKLVMLVHTYTSKTYHQVLVKPQGVIVRNKKKICISWPI